jgi:hypothetical protein
MEMTAGTEIVKQNKISLIVGGCQLPCVSRLSASRARDPFVSLSVSIKRALAYQWNYYFKSFMKKRLRHSSQSAPEIHRMTAVRSFRHEIPLTAGDRVRVRSLEEINSTLNQFNELGGCAFLLQMHQYCGTEQKVFRIMERFLDERDYKVKKTKGLVLLENNYCNGTPVFGQCDRSCFLFWRAEWLEKV